MPKIVITDAKGLVQQAGSGIDIQSSGLQGVIRNDITLTGGPGDIDGSFTLPAGALITEIALVTTDSFQAGNTNADDTLQLKVGLSAGGEEIITAPAVESGFVEQNGIAPVGSRMSTSSGAKMEANSTAFTLTGASLYSATARTIHHRVVIVNAALTAAGAVRLECKYTII